MRLEEYLNGQKYVCSEFYTQTAGIDWGEEDDEMLNIPLSIKKQITRK